MNILALDLATKTGWATNLTRGMHSGVQEFGIKRGESPGMRYLRLRAWLEDMRSICLSAGKEGGFHVLAYEQAHQRGGAATEICIGLATEAQAWAAQNNIDLMPVHTATLKKFATGKGNAKKPDMIAAAQARGWNPRDDNEADAQWLLAYAESEVGNGRG